MVHEERIVNWCGQLYVAHMSWAEVAIQSTSHAAISFRMSKRRLQGAGVEGGHTQGLVVDASALGLAQMVEGERVQHLLHAEPCDLLVRVEAVGGRVEAVADQFPVKLQHRY